MKARNPETLRRYALMPDCKAMAWPFARKVRSTAACWFSQCETANQVDADTINPAMATTSPNREYRVRHQLGCERQLGSFRFQ
jgi:hypothetical protein